MLFDTRRYHLRFVWLFLGSMLLLSLLFTSCKDALFSADQATPTARMNIVEPTALVSPHTLTIGIYANYFPQEYMDANQHIIGFDVDVIQTIAQRLHLQTKFVNEDYSMLINDLMQSRFDVVVSAVSISPEVQKKADFIPYFKGGESLLVAKGNPHRIYALSDLCGRAVAIKDGSVEQRELKDISANCVKERRRAISVVVSTAYSDALYQVTLGQVMAIYQDSPVTDYYVNLYPNRFEAAGAVIGTNLEGIAVRKNNADLLGSLQRAFSSLKADGSYRKIIMKWGLTSGDITANDVTGT